MDETAKARDLEEQATTTRPPWGPAMGPGARTSLAPLGESCERAYGELDLLRGKAAGDRWDGWRLLTGDEDYFGTRELYASVESQQRCLSRALKQSGNLLSASKDQADRFVAVLEHAAARVAPEWAKTGASVRREQALQCQVERVKGWRSGIVAAAGALAAVAKEVALAGQDLETRYRTGSAQDGRLAGEAANRHGGRGVVAG